MVQSAKQTSAQWIICVVGTIGVNKEVGLVQPESLSFYDEVSCSQAFHDVPV